MTSPITTAAPKRLTVCAAALGLGLAAVGLGLATAAPPALAAKDVGPTDVSCDHHAKDSAAWRTCSAAQAFQGSDAELFYAGYWLAKTGRYQEALTLLTRIAEPDASALTYIGYATRHLGRTDEALRHYEAALKREPDNAVTRSYMGEAFITLGRLDDARGELNRIAAICGTSCEAYRDLDTALSSAN